MHGMHKFVSHFVWIYSRRSCVICDMFDAIRHSLSLSGLHVSQFGSFDEWHPNRWKRQNSSEQELVFRFQSGASNCILRMNADETMTNSFVRVFLKKIYCKTQSKHILVDVFFSIQSVGRWSLWERKNENHLIRTRLATDEFCSSFTWCRDSQHYYQCKRHAYAFRSQFLLEMSVEPPISRLKYSAAVSRGPSWWVLSTKKKEFLLLPSTRRTVAPEWSSPSFLVLVCLFLLINVAIARIKRT